MGLHCQHIWNLRAAELNYAMYNVELYLQCTQLIAETKCYETVQIRTTAATATNVLGCKNVLTFLLSVLKSD